MYNSRNQYVMKYSTAAIFASKGSVTRATRRLGRFENVHILLVEDHPDTRVILLKLLARCGHDVAAAETNGCGAIPAGNEGCVADEEN